MKTNNGQAVSALVLVLCDAEAQPGSFDQLSYLRRKVVDLGGVVVDFKGLDFASQKALVERVDLVLVGGAERLDLDKMLIAHAWGHGRNVQHGVENLEAWFADRRAGKHHR